MLMSLLDGMSHATCSRGFTWCSMKSIGSVSLCNKITSSLVRSVPVRVATVPSLVVYPVSPLRGQSALQAASILITEKLTNGSCVSFLYQTTHCRNVPLERTKIQIWANNPLHKKNWPSILPPQRNILTCSFLLCLSEIHKRFLHACTPERRTRACAYLFHQREHGQAPQTKKHILQKNVQGAETLGNDTSGGASKPHRSKYIASA